MRGIVLAGGSGTRLDPITRVASKQLQPVYDKPMVYYPLATFLEAGITDILLISTPSDTHRFQALLGDGSQWGVSISYATQDAPRGIAEALLIGAGFIGDERVALILGDNVFHGATHLPDLVSDFETGAVIFGYPVINPGRYGVVTLGRGGEPLAIEEKPANPLSILAIPGLYLYDNRCVEIARALKPSARGELEISDVNRVYLDAGQLKVVQLGQGVAWLDSGTHDSLLEAANFIATIEHRQGLKIACLEEVAYRHGYIDRSQLALLVEESPDSSYRDYLARILQEPAQDT